MDAAVAEWEPPPTDNTEAAKPNHEQPEDIIVFVEPENAAAVRLFRQVRGTQWHTQVVVAGKHLLRVRTGLDYAILPALAAGLKPPVELSEEVMDGLRLMEAEALAIFDRRNARLLRQG